MRQDCESVLGLSFRCENKLYPPNFNFGFVLGMCSDHSGTELTSGKTPSGKVGYYVPSKNCGIMA